MLAFTTSQTKAVRGGNNTAAYRAACSAESCSPMWPQVHLQLAALVYCFFSGGMYLKENDVECCGGMFVVVKGRLLSSLTHGSLHTACVATEAQPRHASWTGKLNVAFMVDSLTFLCLHSSPISSPVVTRTRASVRVTCQRKGLHSTQALRPRPVPQQ